MKSFSRNLLGEEINVLNIQHANFSKRLDKVFDDTHVAMQAKWQLDYSTPRES